MQDNINQWRSRKILKTENKWKKKKLIKKIITMCEFWAFHADYVLHNKLDKVEPHCTSATTWDVYLGGVLFEHTDGLRVNGSGFRLQVCNGAVSLNSQDCVGLGHVHSVLDVGCAAVLQLHLLQATLVICIWTETRKRTQMQKLRKLGLGPILNLYLLREDGRFPTAHFWDEND